jgi:hypothetical protein
MRGMPSTQTPQPDDRRRIAQVRLAARARRIKTLRRRVVAGALTTFVLAWGVVWQTGSLGATTTTKATAVTAATTVTSTATETAAVVDTAATSSTSTASSSAPLTSSQS